MKSAIKFSICFKVLDYIAISRLSRSNLLWTVLTGFFYMKKLAKINLLISINSKSIYVLISHLTFFKIFNFFAFFCTYQWFLARKNYSKYGFRFKISRCTRSRRQKNIENLLEITIIQNMNWKYEISKTWNVVGAIKLIIPIFSKFSEIFWQHHWIQCESFLRKSYFENFFWANGSQFGLIKTKNSKPDQLK